MREITHTPSSIDTPVSGRLRRPREKKGAHSFHLSRREPGGYITRESLNARSRRCVSSDGDFPSVCSGIVRDVRSFDTSNHRSV